MCRGHIVIDSRGTSSNRHNKVGSVLIHLKMKGCVKRPQLDPVIEPATRHTFSNEPRVNYGVHKSVYHCYTVP